MISRTFMRFLGNAAMALTLTGITLHASARPGRPPVAQSVEKSLAHGDHSFCERKYTKLNSDNEPLCPLAEDLKDCASLQQACAKHEPPAPPPKADWKVPPILATLAKALMWLLLAAVVIAFGFFLVRALLHARRDQKLTTPALKDTEATVVTLVAQPIEAPLGDAEVLLARAEALRARGDYKGALSTYLQASLRALDDRGEIRIRRSTTRGEYLRALGNPEARTLLRTLVRAVDRVEFGGDEPSEQGVTELAPAAVALVRARQAQRGGVNAAYGTGVLSTFLLTLLLGSFAVGCGSPGSKGKTDRADTPEGHELLRHILVDQGFKAEPMPMSFASLPIPEVADTAPCVLVDADELHLDEESAKHLDQWVNAGGTLIIGGSPKALPEDLRSELTEMSASKLLVFPLDDESARTGTDEDVLPPLEARLVLAGALKASPSAIVLAERGGDPFATLREVGKGRVLTLATPELFTNVSMAHAQNAEAFVALFDHLTWSPAKPLYIARFTSGIAPPSSPVASLDRAGLGKALAHAVAAAFILFLAVGLRMAKPRSVKDGQRRAFVEHIEAVGLFYARHKSSAYVLAAYTRFLEGRVHSRMPRGVNTLGEAIALRTGIAQGEVEELLTSASAISAEDRDAPQNLTLLARLRDVAARLDTKTQV